MFILYKHRLQKAREVSLQRFEKNNTNWSLSFFTAVCLSNMLLVNLLFFSDVTGHQCDLRGSMGHQCGTF